ncbi:prolyl oligopeptidase family serine peptidase [Hyunsoonleella sp. SJ7]|uniref:Prolyl oligopeptidase family serine peptidase n=1 Tax=Hyunsoonleella aquatilis TaxID=2762758 RepID=A0A923H880_9FLAO|nr:prolyl oligopeptidase family serine peptidase [Hyunsoonleella aquatilis]MBC3758095.1 prolyl oligopeptidase family serine peptidase [Hyunsoonleella aquatilis]
MKYLINFVFFAFLGFYFGNGQSLTMEDYERAVSYSYSNAYNKSVFNLHTEVNWFKNKSGLWFIEYSDEGRQYKKYSFKRNKTELFFDHNKLANSLSNILKDTVSANELNLSKIELIDDVLLSFSAFDKTFHLNLETYELELKETERQKELENEFEKKSPDGKWLAYTKDYNLFIKSVATDEEYKLSNDGKKNYEYASYYGWYDKMEGENGERPKRFEVNWSPDSKWLATNVIDLQQAEKMYLLDWSIDSLYKPKLLSYYRGSPGDTTMVHVQPVFYNIEAKQEVKTKLPKNTHINQVSVRWSDSSGIFYADYMERGFKTSFVKEVNLSTNSERILIKETSETNIDNFYYKVLEKKGRLIFLSQQSGWRQLYSLDLITSKITPLTNGNYFINDISYIDEDNGVVYFLASGKEDGENPYHQKLYKVSLKGEVTLLTPEKGHHDISFSEDGLYFADNYSTVQIPTKTVVRSSKNGKVLAKLTQADVSKVISKGWKAPEVFQLTAKDGKTTIYGAIWKPTNFDSLKSYPIIDATYTGPHTQRFPKSFRSAFYNQDLSELGFIIMQVDGLGTSGRSKAFLNHSYKDMGNNLEDHVLAIKYLGEKYKWIDTEKVGIFGHSAGGYDTGRAMTAFPDVYKVGVASSGDHDFRMEKAWWPEMYQGWPVDETYEAVSNITNAKNLKGKLLLVHGGLDDNVNPSATFKFAEALIKADKDFDMLIIPSQRHGYVGKYRDYFIKRRWNYFVEHLLGEKPIWNFSLKL